ncbi:MAG: hypothetical protein HY689_12440 [Chloroflexi bacterium]|nr:hypothetical protein [Chloroflexota bacterium]
MVQTRCLWTDEHAAAGTDFALGAAIAAVVFLAMTALLDIPLSSLLDDLLHLVEAILLP